MMISHAYSGDKFVLTAVQRFYPCQLSKVMCQFKECNMLVVGLDNSGKSTILNHFMPEEQKRLDIVPTVGFNVEKFKSRA